LVVSEVGVLWQIKDGLVLASFTLISFIVVHFNKSLPNEIHFLNIALIADHDFPWCGNPAVHLDDQFVGEATLTLLKEVIERSLELFEDPGVLDEVGLHLWSDLLIELELFDDKIEIIEECLLYILSNVIIECRLNVEWLVGFFNFLNPHVKRVKFFFNQIIEVI